MISALGACAEAGGEWPPRARASSGPQAKASPGHRLHQGEGYRFSAPEEFRPEAPPEGAEASFHFQLNLEGLKPSLTVVASRLAGGLPALEARWKKEGLSPGQSLSKGSLGGLPAWLRQGKLGGDELKEISAAQGDRLVQVIVRVPEGLSQLKRADFARLEDQVLASFAWDPPASPPASSSP